MPQPPRPLALVLAEVGLNPGCGRSRARGRRAPPFGVRRRTRSRTPRAARPVTVAPPWSGASTSEFTATSPSSITAPFAGCASGASACRPSTGSAPPMAPRSLIRVSDLTCGADVAVHDHAQGGRRARAGAARRSSSRRAGRRGRRRPCSGIELTKSPLTLLDMSAPLKPTRKAPSATPARLRTSASALPASVPRRSRPAPRAISPGMSRPRSGLAPVPRALERDRQLVVGRRRRSSRLRWEVERDEAADRDATRRPGAPDGTVVAT